jgi:hypothetical protein
MGFFAIGVSKKSETMHDSDAPTLRVAKMAQPSSYHSVLEYLQMSCSLLNTVLATRTLTHESSLSVVEPTVLRDRVPAKKV